MNHEAGLIYHFDYPLPIFFPIFVSFYFLVCKRKEGITIKKYIPFSHGLNETDISKILICIMK